MPHCARRSYPTKDAIDLTDENWSSPCRPTAGVRPTSIAARSSTHCRINIARAANGTCVRTMVRQCVRFDPLCDPWNRDGTLYQHQ